MARGPQDIKGFNGSIRVGTTGTISCLMMQELDSPKHSSQPSVSSKRSPQTRAVSVSRGVSTKRTSSNAAHRMPMLNAEKPIKKVSQIVEIVDLKCGNFDRGEWSTPISNQLKKKKKLRFSRLAYST